MRISDWSSDVCSSDLNAAAGAVRKKDPAETAKRGLRFFAYATGELSQALAPYQSELVAELSRLGFVTNPLFATFDTLEGLISHFEKIELLRPSLEYDIDGVVYKVASIADQEDRKSTRLNSSH